MTQNEIFWRIRMGIDMKRELDLWKLSLKSESKEIRKLTEKLSKKMIFKNYKILLIQFCKKSSFISPFLNFIKTRINSKKGIKYMSIDDLYNNEIIK